MKKISCLIALVASLGALVLADGGASALTNTATLTSIPEVPNGITLQACTPPAGLISWWPGDWNAEDFWDYNDGTLNGNVSFLTGMVGQTLQFSGEGDYIEVPHSTSLDITGAITMETWFKSTDVTNTGSMIVCKGDYQGSQGLTAYALHVGAWDNNDGSVTIVLYGSYPQDWYYSGPNLIQPNQWYHIAATWDGTTANPDNVKLYINGALVKSWTKTMPLASTTESLTIGSMKPPTYYHPTNGLIDELAIYNRALSASEIKAIFYAGSMGKCLITPVDIDIKPGSFPNAINLSSAGVIPVAILGSGTFDATQVNPETVSLAGAKVKLIGKTGDKYACSFQDVNDDDLLDVVCHVLTAQLFIEVGSSVVVLEAETFDGQKIRGQDSIQIVP